MRFKDIVKPRFASIFAEGTYPVQKLIESKEGKNVHLEHLEDNIFNRGFEGAREALDYLYSLHEMLEGHSKEKVNMTTKWDGAPAIICGKDPATGKFFVGTKGVFAKNPKLNFTVADIRRNHPAEGLQEKLIASLKHLRKLNIDTVVQGDLLWTKGDIKETTIEGERYIIFQPNTIVYAVPADSDMAKRMLQAEIGIVFHTEYIGGPTLADTSSRFGFDSSVLSKNKSVWYRDAIIRDLSGTVTLTSQESGAMMAAIEQANNYLKTIGSETFAWLEQGQNEISKDFITQLKAHVNANIKTAGSFEKNPNKFAKDFITRFVQRKEKDIEKYKTEKKKDEHREILVNGVKFLRGHLKNIVAVYDLYLLLIEAKLLIVRKLENVRQMNTFVRTEDGGFQVTGEEGFVAVDHMGNALKLVDRLEFSLQNFGSGKPGQK